MTQLYRALKSDDLIQHELDGMTLIFQKASGITHMVADPIPAILEVMADGAISAQSITKKLIDGFDVEQGVDVENIVLARLEELCELALVERVVSA